MLAERIRAIAGLGRILPSLEALPPTFLVGGTVRDLLRGAACTDIDVAIEGDAAAAARAIATTIGGRTRVHERFGTARIETGRLALDIAATRTERYPNPGALPEVAPASLAEDLARRDFTINAMAVALTPPELGRLHDPHSGENDLRSGQVRVLHPRSFLEDPTRLLRAVRYEARLGFRMHPETELLAREAARGGALSTMSVERVRDSLLKLLAEPDVVGATERLAELGLDRALHSQLAIEHELIAAATLAAEQVGADRVLVALAALVASSPAALAGWLGSLGLTRDQWTRASRAAERAPELARELAFEHSPAQLHDLLSDEPAEALALALAIGAPPEPVTKYVREIRGARLEITGDDLLAAGVPESPAVGQALRETLRRKLDGEVSGRAAELALALALARGEG